MILIFDGVILFQIVRRSNRLMMIIFCRWDRRLIRIQLSLDFQLLRIELCIIVCDRLLCEIWEPSNYIIATKFVHKKVLQPYLIYLSTDAADNLNKSTPI